MQLTPLGDELVALSKNIEQGFTTYNDLIGIVKKKFVVEQDMIDDELKAKLLSKNWKLEDIPFHNQWLEDALQFMVKSSLVIFLTLFTSYIRATIQD